MCIIISRGTSPQSNPQMNCPFHKLILMMSDGAIKNGPMQFAGMLMDKHILRIIILWGKEKGQ